MNVFQTGFLSFHYMVAYVLTRHFSKQKRSKSRYHGFKFFVLNT